MIFKRGYCAFCSQHVSNCKGGLYTSGTYTATARICIYCLRKAFREFNEPEPGPAEVIQLRPRARFAEEEDQPA
jgi:hypothetical protein